MYIRTVQIKLKIECISVGLAHGCPISTGQSSYYCKLTCVKADCTCSSQRKMSLFRMTSCWLPRNMLCREREREREMREAAYAQSVQTFTPKPRVTNSGPPLVSAERWSLLSTSVVGCVGITPKGDTAMHWCCLLCSIWDAHSMPVLIRLIFLSAVVWREKEGERENAVFTAPYAGEPPMDC